MATQIMDQDPLLNINGLLQHIFRFREDAYSALKMALSRLPEPERTMFVTKCLSQSMDFCIKHHLISKLAPLDYDLLAATAKKHNFKLWGNDPTLKNFWKLQPDSFHYYYLKMLLARLPEQIRFSISTRLLLILFRDIDPKIAFLPYNPEKFKWTTLGKAKVNESISAPLVNTSLHQSTPTPVSPLLDPLNSEVYWNVVNPDNVYPLLKQFLARCPSETRTMLCFKMLKSCINYVSDKDILASYEPSKANHLPSDSVPMKANGKTYILPFGEPMENGQQNSSWSAESSPEQEEVVSGDSYLSSNSFDESAQSAASVVSDCKATSPGQTYETEEAYRDIVWTRVSKLQLAENPNVPDDFDWTQPPEEDTTSEQACSMVDSSSSFDCTNFAWERTPSFYYHRDSPLQLAEVSGFSSSFDWTRPPSEGVGEEGEVANTSSSGTSEQPVEQKASTVDEKHWLKTPTTAGCMAPRRSLLNDLELIELPTDEAVFRANKTFSATETHSTGNIYSFIASRIRVMSVSCPNSSHSGVPVLERVPTDTSPTTPTLYISSDAATQTPSRF